MRILICLFLVCTTFVSYADSRKKSIDVDIKAARVELDQKNNQIRFTGQVKVTRGHLEMTADRIVARYTPDGDIIDLQLTGHLSLRGRDFTAEAQQGRYEHKTARLVLTGTPKVKQGPHSMSGQRIIVFLNDEKVIVEQARGRIRMPVKRDRLQ